MSARSFAGIVARRHVRRKMGIPYLAWVFFLFLVRGTFALAVKVLKPSDRSADEEGEKSE